MTSYQEVYDVFLREIDDVEILYPLPNESEEDYNTRVGYICLENLKGVIPRFFYSKTKLICDHKTEMFENTLRPIEIEILGFMMLRQYYRKKLNYLASLKHSFSDKDWKSHDKSNAMNQYRQMLKEAQDEIRGLIANNEYFDDNGKMVGWWGD